MHLATARVVFSWWIRAQIAGKVSAERAKEVSAVGRISGCLFEVPFLPRPDHIPICSNTVCFLYAQVLSVSRISEGKDMLRRVNLNEKPRLLVVARVIARVGFAIRVRLEVPVLKRTCERNVTILFWCCESYDY